MRGFTAVAFCLLIHPFSTFAEVTGVTINSRTLLAGGQSFGATGSYERLVGRIEFALDPADPHNGRIVDLNHAKRDAEGRVRFSSDLNVVRPTDPTKGNGVLLFHIANRGVMDLMAAFNRGTASDGGIGDGLLMRDGYTMVFVGWEFDVPAARLRIEAPAAILPAGSSAEPLGVEIMVNELAAEAFLIDDPAGRPPVPYLPAELSSANDVLIVRDRFLEAGTVIPRARWRFVVDPNGLPKIQLDGGFEPGRYYRVTYYATTPVVAGVGGAAIRDAASAFRYRSDLPVHGRSVYAFGQSQAGRFLRQFLYDGFNVDERDRRVFDAVWVHKAGAARGSFNERFATPSPGDLFRPTRFPFSDSEQIDTDGTRAGLSSRYRADQRPKIFYVNTSVEYWGGGRAATLTHTTLDGERDLVLPDNIRIYFLASTQHIVPAFPPVRTPPASGATDVSARERSGGQQLNNPTPHANVMRALLRAWHQWAADGISPPISQYPRLRDKTLVPIQETAFPSLPSVANPRSIQGPARTTGETVMPLPHLVPQVDRDGNDLGGIRDPDVAVPLATNTGWNFRDPSVGNPGEIYQLLGSYVPFAPTKVVRQAAGDSRLSVEERYRSIDDYIQRIRSSAMGLIERRYLLAEDLEVIVERAKQHWAFATRQTRQEKPRTLVAVWAHADDEGPIAPILARYAREGAQVYMIIVTDGAQGAANTSVPRGPGIAKLRVEEAGCAARALGVHPPILLGFPDGALGHYNADPSLLFRVTQRVHEEIQQLRPDVLITWGPDGGYGHPDHRIVSSIVTQLARAGAPGVPQRVFYGSLPAEGIRAMYPARGVPPFVIPQPNLFTVRVPFTDGDLQAARRSFECHKTQVSQEAIDRVIPAMRDAWKGEIPLSPMLPQAPANDLFR